MSRIRQTKGFTLVELLVVISIIALLIGILIPAIASARTSARIVVDLASLRQHGIGTASYAGDNKDNMPNAQPGRGGRGEGGISDGSKHRPQGIFFSPQYPTNGMSFNGIPLHHGNIWKIYNMIFGDYMVDGATGLDLLDPVFLSAGDSRIRNRWEVLRAVKPGDPDVPIFPTGYSTGGAGTGQMDNFFIGNADELTDEGNIGYWTGTWRYTLTAVVDKDEVDGGYFWGQAEGGNFQDLSSGWTNQDRWRTYRSYVKQSSYAFPSEKVTFWDPGATNSPGSYVEVGAKVPVVMVDSSARVSEPVRECLDPNNSQDIQKISNAFLAGDFVSTFFKWSADTSQNQLYSRPLADPPTQFPAWFMTGIQGVSTRDFGGKSLN